jgi:hypothetical protein
MTAIPCDVIQEYIVPRGVTAIRIEMESGGQGGHSSTAVTLQVRPTATVRPRFTCLPAPRSSADPTSPPSLAELFVSTREANGKLG